MAIRDYKVQITSTEGNEEFYVHDNNAVERITLPIIEPIEHLDAHIKFTMILMCYMRCHKCSKLEVTKV